MDKSSTSWISGAVVAVAAAIGIAYVTAKQAAANAASAQQSEEIKQLRRTMRLLAESVQPSGRRRSMRRGSAEERSPSPSITIPGTPTKAPTIPANESGNDIYHEMKQLLENNSKLQINIRELQRVNRELQRQLTLTEVSNVVDVETKYATPVGDRGVKLTASEIETIRAIFNMFDTSQSGTISIRELRALHAKLGEPLTEEEAAQAIRDLDNDGSGVVDFNKFLFWYISNQDSNKKGTEYTNRFKLIHAKLHDTFSIDKVVTQDSGTPFTLEYRLNFYYKQNNQSLKPISPWHDVPLYRLGTGDETRGQLYNFVCEIPKWTRAKFECATGEPYNPIKQDTQHGKLRYYKHGDMMFNYGYFPQTWEDPQYIPADTKCPGDNDPIDVLDIGAKQLRTGAIVAVKILGVLALIDDGETDWKVLAINIADPMAHLLNDVDDIETHLPGAIKAIREYFRDYKSFSGKINSYALRAQAMPRHYAVKVIQDTHHHWQSLHIHRKQDTVSKPGASPQIVLPSPMLTNRAPSIQPPPALLESAEVPADVAVGQTEAEAAPAPAKAQ